MRITRPNPEPREDGDYCSFTNGVAYGKPYGSIKLDDAGHLRLDDITLDDARRLAKAAMRIEQELTAAHARMKAPHGGEHFYQGTCQLCGKPEDDELHAEPEPLKISDSTIAAAAYFAQPGNTVDDVLAAQRADKSVAS
jgi:hypothetical protein